MDILNTKYNIILGSKSPRRKELLELMGLKFKVKNNNVVETYSNKLRPHLIAEYLSKKKAAAYIIDKKDLIIYAAAFFFDRYSAIRWGLSLFE
jgi:septum formation protein